MSILAVAFTNLAANLIAFGLLMLFLNWSLPEDL